jgi:D-alanyl-lipoteichoic acid acyltransferase DltB (MBOAT superfamily)
MLFNTFDFLAFFTIVFLVQLALPHRARNLWLLAASWFFYGCWSWKFLLLLIGSTVFDYCCSRAIGAATSPVKRRWLLAAGCCVNLSVLGFFKYFNFFIESAHHLLAQFGMSGSPWLLRIVLPVGVSFYTFQSISYYVDVYRRQVEPLRNYFDFALYISFFPQLVAGPIERGRTFAPQMLKRPPFSWDNFHDGIWLALKGLFKKAVIADNLAPIVSGVFSNAHPSGPEVLLGVYAFAFQIYGDFSGYTDIARGTARMLGYNLRLNFRLPYFAVNPSDFWHRWHISLSSWLRDYLYIPLGGNRGGLAGTCRNLMITMILGGLWHGAAWTFVLWGVFHGVLLVAFRLFSDWRARRGDGKAGAPLAVGSLQWIVRVLVMFQITCFGWLIFRAQNLAQVAEMTKALFRPWYVTADFWQRAWQVGILCVPLVAVQYFEEASGNLNFIRNVSFVPRACIYAATLFALLAIGDFGGREFIYFQF